MPPLGHTYYTTLRLQTQGPNVAKNWRLLVRNRDSSQRCFSLTSLSLHRLILGGYYFLKASKFDRVITGVDQPNHFWFDIREVRHILFAAAIPTLHRQPLPIYRDTCHALNEIA
jgi:hypothetical protein